MILFVWGYNVVAAGIGVAHSFRGFNDEIQSDSGIGNLLVIAPLTIAGFAPLWIAGWHLHPPFFGLPIIRMAGVFLVLSGAIPLVESFARFALEGLGTPAPIAPPKHLIVTGSYCYVRNPMYVGVVMIIVGQAVILGSIPVLVYAALVWLSFHMFVLLYEEPTLRRDHGAEYEAFCARVPRWLPRLSPWTGSDSANVDLLP
jgi:protein-S-isoprenylcysteine O-methyltransferase Ste14